MPNHKQAEANLELQLEALLGFGACELDHGSLIAEWLTDAELIDRASESDDPMQRELASRYAYLLDLTNRIIGVKR